MARKAAPSREAPAGGDVCSPCAARRQRRRAGQAWARWSGDVLVHDLQRAVRLWRSRYEKLVKSLEDPGTAERLAVVAVHLKDMVHGKTIESPVDTLRRHVALHAASDGVLATSSPEVAQACGVNIPSSGRPAEGGAAPARKLAESPPDTAIPRAGAGVASAEAARAAGADAVHDGEIGTELDGHDPLLAVPPFPLLVKELSDHGTIATHELAVKQGVAGMQWQLREGAGGEAEPTRDQRQLGNQRGTKMAMSNACAEIATEWLAGGPHSRRPEEALVGTIEHEEEHGVEAMHKGQLLAAAAAAAEADNDSATQPPLPTCVVDFWERLENATKGIETTMKWDGTRAAKRGMTMYQISQLEAIYGEAKRVLDGSDDGDDDEAELERFEVQKALESAWLHIDTLESEGPVQAPPWGWRIAAISHRSSGCVCMETLGRGPDDP
ncbi:unnamed protein product [Prorocentrum cordatum]|uniref:Uncharacterized protein n=1 Tax=Prorocentrum cordatum TaxID=2364126 RepID=A0ABN9VVQ7_9DINO|nr:unnamed protein product [Polarella glacialis]